MNLKLIKNTENINKEKITLFCLPFAGGGASAYNQWAKKMQGKVTVCPVQLPGREEQIMEKPYIDMSVMLDDLEEAVRKVVYGPYALWGHSMGGKIAYELEKRLEAAGYTAKCLFISGSRVPSIPEPNPIYHLPDEEFKRELGRFEGTPKEVLENQELLDFFLPMLRADFTMDETYMVPQNYHFMAQLPTLSNGKINRKKLREDFKEETSVIRFSKAVTETEEKLLDIWKRMFGYENLGTEDNYFVLGGDSLIATKLISDIQKEFGCKIMISDIFENVTIKLLAQKIDLVRQNVIMEDIEMECGEI